MKLLTIAIPTYNRAEKLRNILELIRNSTIPDNPAIGLICVNNASADHTLSVLVSFQKAYSGSFQFYTNPENCGLVGNVIKCFEYASAEYTWVIGDDDVVDFSHIADIGRLLLERHPAGILLNAGILSDRSQSWYPVEFPENDIGAKNTFIRRIFPNKPGHFMWISNQILNRHLALHAYRQLPSAQSNLAAPLYACMNCMNDPTFIFYRPFVVFLNNLAPTSWIKRGRIVNWIDMPLVYQAMIDTNIFPTLAEQNLKQFFKTFRLRSVCGLILRHPSVINIKRLALMLFWQLKRGLPK